MPAASSIRNALSSGEPNSALMAAKLPAAAITVVAVGGASRAARRTASAPSPLPMRMSGASGPRTTPKLNVPSAASRMLGRSTGGVTPAAWNPSAGECPPLPGRRLIARATTTPPTTSRGRGHQAGGESKPRSFGRLVKNAD
jgi:hypothetical protein